MSNKILIPTKLSTVAKGILEDAGFNVVQAAGVALEELAKEHSDAAGMIVRSEKLTPEVIDLYPALKAVVRAGAGYNTIDTKYARSKDNTTRHQKLNLMFRELSAQLICLSEQNVELMRKIEKQK